MKQYKVLIKSAEVITIEANSEQEAISSITSKMTARDAAGPVKIEILEEDNVNQ